MVEIEEGKAFVVQPGEFVLGVTLEKIKIADDLVARVEGRVHWEDSGSSSIRRPGSWTPDLKGQSLLRSPISTACRWPCTRGCASASLPLSR